MKSSVEAPGATVDAEVGPGSTRIAIIGIGSVFPRARHLRELWQNILDEVDCITEVPASRWRIEDHFDPDPAAPDKTYCKRGAFIPELEISPLELGLPPNTLEAISVAQIVALVVARAALEDAGYGGADGFDRERTGVILGVASPMTPLGSALNARLQSPVWEKVLRSRGLAEPEIARIVETMKLAYVGWQEDSFPGTLANVVAGRIANRLDLGGINCTVDAACASSLSAVRMAVDELVLRRCDMVLTGGVDVDNSIQTYLCFSKTPAFTREDRLRPFDAQSAGMMVGEGVGMVVLKRLADAERDGDRIYAVIRGIGASSDGRRTSIYAPCTEGQVKALRRAYAEAGFSPGEIGLLEAHGTGTAAGDAVELAALNEALGPVPPDQPEGRPGIALGSIKSQVGHTKAAAGAAGLIKAALALHHKILPATLNVRQPHPALAAERSRLFLNTAARPWLRQAPGRPRRAGVSSFGFGGANYHLVLEDHRGEHTGPYRLHAVPAQIVLSAPTPAELAAQCREAAARLETADGALELARLAQATRHAVPGAFARLGFVAASAPQARDLLGLCLDRLARSPGEEWDDPRGVSCRRAALPAARVVGLFPGQGSQYPEMGRELLLNFPPLRQAYEALDDFLSETGREPISGTVFPPPAFDEAERLRQARRLQDTRNAQLALAGASMGLYELLRQAGLTPDLLAGHSFGELTALWAAGALDRRDFFSLVCARAEAMAAGANGSGPRGAMLAVRGEVSRLQRELAAVPSLVIANFNARDQVVLSGPEEAIDEAGRRLPEQGYTVLRLPVSGAFHSPWIGYALDATARAVDGIDLRSPRVPVYSNVTGEALPREPAALRELLRQHLAQPVLFQRQIENLYEAGGRIFVEIGPRSILTRLVGDILGDRPHLAVALNASRTGDADRQLRQAVVRLRVAGLDLGGFDPYGVEPAAPEPRPQGGVTLRLEDSLYRKDETRAAFEQALARLSAEAGPARPTKAPPAGGSPAPDGAEGILEGFERFHGELLRAHEQFLATESTYARTLLALTERQQELAVAADPTLGQVLARSMDRIHDHQAASRRVHQSFLEAQTEHGSQVFRLLQERHAPGWQAGGATGAPAASLAAAPRDAEPAAIPSPPAETAAVTREEGGIATALLEVVAEQTGYPQEMLRLEMDVEGDLGIDSIKRVEILGALRERFPGLPRGEARELAELRTLDQMAAHLARQLAPSVATPVAAPAAVPAAAPQPQPGPDRPAVERSVVRIRHLPPPDAVVWQPAGALCVVTDDGTAIAAELAGLLSQRGWRVAVLVPPGVEAGTVALPAGVPRVRPADPGEAALAACLEDLERQTGPLAAWVHLHPSPGTSGIDGETALLRWAWLAARQTAAGLEAAARRGRSCWTTVCSLDGALGLGGTEGVDSALAGGLCGLTKALAREWPQVHCRAIDLAPGLEAELAARRIVAEMEDGDRLLCEVGYGPDGRTTLAAVPAGVITPGDGATAGDIDRSSVFLVSGGGRGITARCIAGLAERHGCGFLLVGRSSIAEPEPAWAEGCEDERALKARLAEQMEAAGEAVTPRRLQSRFEEIRAGREIRATLAAIQRAGGRARYLQVDIRDGARLRQAVAEASRALGEVRGILHGAGVLVDGPIDRKDAAAFDTVWGPKVPGLLNLLHAVPPERLSHLLLFSSVSAFHGNAGQAEYALANEVLNKYAHLFQRRHPHCRVISFNWGPWDGGMVTPELQSHFARQGIGVLPTGAGVRCFLEELDGPRPAAVQVLIGSSPATSVAGEVPRPAVRTLRRSLDQEANAFLADHRIDGAAVLPASCAVAWMAQACEQALPGYRFFACSDFRVCRGVVLRAGGAQDLLLTVEETGPGAPDLATLATRIASVEPVRPALRYSGTVELHTRIPGGPADAPAAPPPGSGLTLPGARLYADGSLFHGPALRGIRQVWHLDDEALYMHCRLPALGAAHQGQFPVLTFNPFTADLLLQAPLVWAFQLRGEACLPVRFQRWEQLLPLPFDEDFSVAARLRSQTEVALVFDLEARDGSGRLAMRLLGCRYAVRLRRTERSAATGAGRPGPAQAGGPLQPAREPAGW